MSELKLVVENASDETSPVKPDLSTLNPVDALNRRDIELIKRSLATMHKDSADMRTTIIALHERNCHVPSKSFFFSLGLLGLLSFGILSAVRPQLETALHHIPVFAKVAPASAQ